MSNQDQLKAAVVGEAVEIYEYLFDVLTPDNAVRTVEGDAITSSAAATLSAAIIGILYRPEVSGDNEGDNE